MAPRPESAEHAETSRKHSSFNIFFERGALQKRDVPSLDDLMMVFACCNAWCDRNLVEELLKDCLKDAIRSFLA